GRGGAGDGLGELGGQRGTGRGPLAGQALQRRQVGGGGQQRADGGQFGVERGGRLGGFGQRGGGKRRGGGLVGLPLLAFEKFQAGGDGVGAGRGLGGDGFGRGGHRSRRRGLRRAGDEGQVERGSALT